MLDRSGGLDVVDEALSASHDEVSAGSKVSGMLHHGVVCSIPVLEAAVAEETLDVVTSVGKRKRLSEAKPKS